MIWRNKNSYRAMVNVNETDQRQYRVPRGAFVNETSPNIYSNSFTESVILTDAALIYGEIIPGNFYLNESGIRQYRVALRGYINESRRSSNSPNASLTFTFTESESVTGADSEVTVLTVNAADPEVITGADNNINSNNAVNTTSDSVTAADTDSALAIINDVENESVTGADSLLPDNIIPMSISDAVTASDSPAPLAIINDVENESVTGADSLSPNLVISQILTELLISTDSLALIYTINAALNEFLSIADNLGSLTGSISEFVADGYYLNTGTANQYFIPGRGYANDNGITYSIPLVRAVENPSFSDGVTAGDINSPFNYYTYALSEVLTALDSLVNAMVIGYSQRETIIATDGSTVVFQDFYPAQGFVNETNQRQYLNFGRGFINETGRNLNTIAAAVNFTASESESSTLADGFTSSGSLSYSEMITPGYWVNEKLARQYFIPRRGFINEKHFLTIPAVYVIFQFAPMETVTGADSYGTSATLLPSFTESAVLSDLPPAQGTQTTGLFGGILPGATGFAGVTNAVQSGLASPYIILTVNAPTSDTVTGGDSNAALSGIIDIVSEGISASDSPAANLIITEAQAESLLAGDIQDPFNLLVNFVSENISSSDTITGSNSVIIAVVEALAGSDGLAIVQFYHTDPSRTYQVETMRRIWSV